MPHSKPKRLLTLVKTVAVVGICFSVGRLGEASPVHQSLPDYAVAELAMSGDGTRLAMTGRVLTGQSTSDGYSYPIDIVDTATGQIVNSINSIWPAPTFVALSPDGSLLGYAAVDGSARVMETMSGTLLTPLFSCCASDIGGMAWSPVSDRVAVFLGNTIYLFDGQSGEQIAVFDDADSPGPITSIAWSFDGALLASTTSFFPEDGSNPTLLIQVWDPTSQSASPVRRFVGGGGFSLAWSPDNSRLAASVVGGPHVYDVTLEQEVAVLCTGDNQPVLKVAWSPDGSWIAAGGSALWVWNVTTGQSSRTIDMPGIVDSIIWSEDSNHIYHNGGVEGVYRDGMPLEDAISTPTAPSTPSEMPAPTAAPTFTPSIVGRGCA